MADDAERALKAARAREKLKRFQAAKSKKASAAPDAVSSPPPAPSVHLHQQARTDTPASVPEDVVVPALAPQRAFSPLSDVSTHHAAPYDPFATRESLHRVNGSHQATPQQRHDVEVPIVRARVDTPTQPDTPQVDTRIADALRSENKELQTRLRSIEEQLQKEQSVVPTLENELVTLRVQNERLQDEALRARQHAEQWEAETAAEMEAFQAEIEDKDDRIASLLAALEDLERSASTQRDEKSTALEAELDRSRRAHDDLQSELQRLQSGHSSSLRDLRTMYDEAQDRIATLERELSAAKKDREQHETSARSAGERQAEALRAELAEKDDQVHSLQAQLEEVKSKAADSTAALENERQGAEAVRSELDSVRAQLERAETTLEEAAQRNQSNKTDLQEAHTQIALLTAQLDEAKATVARLESDSSTAVATASAEHAAALAALQSALEAAERKGSEAIGRHQEALRQVEDATTSRKALEDELAAARTELDQMTRARDAAKDLHEQDQRQVEEASTSRDAIRDELAAVKARLDDLRGTHDSAKEELESLRATHASAQEELEKLRESKTASGDPALQTKVAELQKALEQREKDIRQAFAELQNAQEDLASVRRGTEDTLRSSRSIIGRLEDEVSSAKAALATSQARQKELQDSLEAAERDNDEAAAVIAERDEELRAQVDHIKDLTSSLAQTTSHAAQQSAKAIALERKVRELSSGGRAVGGGGDALKTELAQVRAQLKAAQSQVESLRASRPSEDNAAPAHAEQMTHLEEQLRKANEETARLSAEHASITATHENDVKELARLNAAMTELQSANASLTTTLEKLRATVASLTASRDQQQSLSKADKEAAESAALAAGEKLQSELVALRADVDQATSLRQSVEAELASAKGSIETESKRADAAESSLAAAKDASAVHAQDVENLQQRVAELEAVSAEKEELAARIASLEREVQDKQRRLNESAALRESGEGQQQLELDLSAARREIRTLQERAYAAEATRSEMLKANGDLKSQVESLNAALERERHRGATAPENKLVPPPRTPSPSRGLRSPISAPIPSTSQHPPPLPLPPTRSPLTSPNAIGQPRTGGRAHAHRRTASQLDSIDAVLTSPPPTTAADPSRAFSPNSQHHHHPEVSTLPANIKPSQRHARQQSLASLRSRIEDELGPLPADPLSPPGGRPAALHEQYEEEDEAAQAPEEAHEHVHTTRDSIASPDRNERPVRPDLKSRRTRSAKLGDDLVWCAQCHGDLFVV